jgi:hypothetical protein
MVGRALDLFFGREIEQLITLRDVELLSDRLARLHNKELTVLHVLIAEAA